MVTNPITAQIVGTLRNMRQEVVANGVSPEADALWQHALSLYRMRRERPVADFRRETAAHGIVFDDRLPAFLRRQAE